MKPGGYLVSQHSLLDGKSATRILTRAQRFSPLRRLYVCGWSKIEWNPKWNPGKWNQGGPIPGGLSRSLGPELSAPPAARRAVSALALLPKKGCHGSDLAVGQQ